MVLQLVAEGAAAGLNAIAVYVAELLRADPAYTPRFTPHGLTLVARWGVLAVAAYWLLCGAMRVGVALARRTFWIPRTAVVLWVFLAIVGDPGTPDEVTAVRLGVLVTLSAAWSVATGGRCGEGDRLLRLERRVAALEEGRAE